MLVVRAKRDRGGAAFRWLARTPSELRGIAENWIRSPALDELMDVVGGPGVDAGPDALLAWSAVAFDTRRGHERHDSDRVRLSLSWIEAILAAAEPLGLLATSEPSQQHYSLALVLGGSARSNELRAGLAADEIKRGLRLDRVVLLAADRVIATREREEAHLPVHDRSEWEHLLRSAHRALDLFGCVSNKEDGPVRRRGRARKVANGAGLSVQVVVVPAPSGRDRPTTRDAVRFFLGTSETKRSHVLLITSALFAPYQFFAAAPALIAGGFGVVELIGVATTASDDRCWLAQRYAQEIHAAISASVALLKEDRR